MKFYDLFYNYYLLVIKILTEYKYYMIILKKNRSFGGKLPPSWVFSLLGEKGCKGQKSQSLVCFQTAEW